MMFCRITEKSDYHLILAELTKNYVNLQKEDNIQNIHNILKNIEQFFKDNGTAYDSQFIKIETTDVGLTLKDIAPYVVTSEAVYVVKALFDLPPQELALDYMLAKKSFGNQEISEDLLILKVVRAKAYQFSEVPLFEIIAPVFLKS